MKQSLLFLLTVCGIILSGTNELAAQKKIAEEDTTFVLSDVHIISKKSIKVPSSLFLFLSNLFL